MSEIISKVLLSEVLSKTVTKIYDDTKWIRHNIRSDVRDDDILVLYKDGSTELISVHTVAHKCKEWAYYKQEPKFYVIDSNLTEKGNCWLRDGSDNSKYFYANTEPEAIFKACQWILDNKE